MSEQTKFKDLQGLEPVAYPTARSFNFAIGRSIKRVNTDISGRPAGIASALVATLATGPIVVVSIIVGLWIHGETVPLHILPFFIYVFIVLSIVFSYPVLVSSFRKYLKVDYDDGLIRFHAANRQTTKLMRHDFEGVIGQLIEELSLPIVSAGARESTSMPTYDLMSSFGAYSIVNIGKNRNIFVGRVYANGPYRGFGHIMVALKRPFPHIIIDADANNHNFTATNLTARLPKDVAHKLEGNFPSYFTVFAKNADTARIAYYILPPDTMLRLINYTPMVDIEIKDQVLHMYWQDRSLSTETTPDWQTFLQWGYYFIDMMLYDLVKNIEAYRFDNEGVDIETTKLSLGGVRNSAPVETASKIAYGFRGRLDSVNYGILTRARTYTVLTIVGLVVLATALFIITFLIQFSII